MGFGELLLIFLLVLLFFGAGKLPALGEGLGKALRGLKDAMSGGPPEKPAAPPEPKKELPPRP